MMNLRPLYWIILFAVVAACSGKVALRHRPRRRGERGLAPNRFGTGAPVRSRSRSVPNEWRDDLAARSSGTMIGRYRFSLPRGVMIFEELSARMTLVTAHPMVGRDTVLSRLVTQTTIRLQ